MADIDAKAKKLADKAFDQWFNDRFIELFAAQPLSRGVLAREAFEAGRFSQAETIAELTKLVDRLKLEAQIHSSEARAANASLNEAYQAASGAKGERGNWNGAIPIKKALDDARAEVARLTKVLQSQGHNG